MDEKKGGGEETKVRKAIGLASVSWNGKPRAGRCVLISSFLPSPGGQGSEERCFM